MKKALAFLLFVLAAAAPVSGDDGVSINSSREQFESASRVFEDYGVEGLDALMTSPLDSELNQDFLALVKAGLRNIPREYRNRFQNAGFRINVVTNISKVMSDSEIKHHPRGYPEGATFANLDAYCNYKTKQVVIIQTEQTQKSLPDLSVCHEFGHAFDVIIAPKLSRFEAAAQNEGAWPFFSHTPKFKQAYQMDLSALPESSRAELAYYLQPDRAGQEELFAEMFPLLYCKQAAPGSRFELMRNSFPNVLREMQSALNCYD